MTNVLLEKKGHIAVATINRPKALNALNSQVLEDIDQLVEQVKADDEIRALVITGSGEKAFVAGADIGEMSTLTKAEGEAFGKKGNDVFRKLETLPIPTIAAVNGFALGGGCELSMSCDIRLCADTAVFGQPEAGLGITPGFGGTQRLARLVGMGMAKQLIYTAKNIKADEALRIGLVNAVYPLEELMPAAEKMAETIAKNAPIAVRACKKAINEGISGDFTILLSKAVMDIFAATLFATTLGRAMNLIVLPQFLILCACFYGARFILPLTTEAMLQDFVAVGGLLTLVLGLSIAQIKHISAVNLLPALVLIWPSSWLFGQWIG